MAKSRSANGTLPQGAFSGTKSREYDRRNPVFATAQTGVASNHSSATASTWHTQNTDHAQQDDDLQDISPPQDPNISGMTETEDCYTWLAGKMDGWKENDDYREFFENSIGCNGMLDNYEGSDNDYDDNGGFPTAIGHKRGVYGSGAATATKATSASGKVGGDKDGFTIGPVGQYKRFI
jgi:hypothetical protein